MTAWSETVNRARPLASRLYFYLLLLFTLVFIALQLGLFDRGSLNYFWLVIILGLLGVSLRTVQVSDVETPAWLPAVVLVLVLAIRIYPYWGNPVPLGYDAGLYRFVFEHPLGETWVNAGYPLLFVLVMGRLAQLVGSQFLLIPFFIFLSALTGLVTYLVVQRLYNSWTATLALFLFLVSLAQFEAFTLHLYKNMLGSSLLMVAWLLFKRQARPNWALVMTAALIGGMHRPALMIFGCAYLVWLLAGVVRWREPAFRFALLDGLLILVLTMTINFDRIDTFLLSGVLNVGRSLLNLSGAGGQFMDFRSYFFLHLSVLPFAITGLLHGWRRSVPMATGGLAVLAFVWLNLFFHRRLIVYLDQMVIVYAAWGFHVLYANHKTLGRILPVAILLIFSGSLISTVMQVRPPIRAAEFVEIQQLTELMEDEARIMVTDGRYAPWIKGWVDQPVIAPALFDEDQWNRQEWAVFWDGNDQARLLQRYERPFYIHIGREQPEIPLETGCFEPRFQGNTRLYEFVCP